MPPRCPNRRTLLRPRLFRPSVRAMGTAPAYDLVVVQGTGLSGFSGTERHTCELLSYLAPRRRVALIEIGGTVLAERLSGTGIEVRAWLDGATRDLVARQRADLAAALRSLPGSRILVVVSWYEAIGVDLLRIVRTAYPTVMQIQHTLLPKRARWSWRIHFDKRPRTGIWWYKDWLGRYRKQRLVDLTLAVSEAARRSAVEDGLVPASRTVTCSNWVDTAMWRRDTGSGAALRRELGIASGVHLFGYVGRLHPHKGVELAVQALAELLRISPGAPVALCLVGDGPSRASLEALVDELGVRRFVHFTGAVREPLAAYSAIDTLLFTSHHDQYWSGEAFGLALVEAMSCECRVIAAGFHGVSEVVGDPCCGRLLRSRDARSWAQAMLDEVGLSPETRRELGTQARAFVVGNYDSRGRLAQLEAVLFQTHDRHGHSNLILGAPHTSGHWAEGRPSHHYGSAQGAEEDGAEA